MALLKKFFMASLISFAMLATAPSAMAIEEGPALRTLTDVVKLAEETLAAMKSDEDYSKVSALLKATKQASKEVVIGGPADIPRSKANARIKKSRKAYRAGDKEKAIDLAEKALVLYKQAEAKHFR